MSATRIRPETGISLNDIRDSLGKSGRYIVTPGGPIILSLEQINGPLDALNKALNAETETALDEAKDKLRDHMLKNKS